MAQRSFYSVFARDLKVTRDWYVNLLDYTVGFESDWFIHLQSPQNQFLELGILDREHELVPVAFRAKASGGLLTFVVEDVDESYRRAVALAAGIIERPRNLFYGQRRMLVRDPNGLLVDISSECPADPDWLASLGSD